MPRRRSEPNEELAELLEALDQNGQWILATEEALDKAKEHRLKLWRAALDAGASYRQIAEASGLDHSSVYRFLERYSGDDQQQSG